MFHFPLPASEGFEGGETCQCVVRQTAEVGRRRRRVDEVVEIDVVFANEKVLLENLPLIILNAT